MSRLFRRTYKAIDPATGRVVKRKTKTWYAKVRDENGKVRRVPLSRNKVVAQQQLARLLDKVEKRKAGIYHPAEEHARRPLTDHLADYEAELRAKDLDAEHVQLTTGRLRAILVGCRFTFPADIKAAAVLEFLTNLRREKPRPELPVDQESFTPAELAALLGVGRRAVTGLVRRQGLHETGAGKGRSRRFPRATAEALLGLGCRGLGSQTAAYYWRAFRTFCRWLCSPRQRRMIDNPLADVPGPDPRSDPRHDRRPLSEDELRRLLVAARESTWTWRGLAGEDRYHLYLLACATGYRRGELAALTPSSFDLDACPPVAALPGKRTKNKRPACQPLPGDVADAFRDYLLGRARDVPVWRREQLREIVVALRNDLEAAGIPYAVDGPDGPLFFDFHSLRHSYVLLLDRSGATVKEAMQLARHSDPKLTMARYGRAQLHDLGAAVGRLPCLAGGPETAEAARATGTEGGQLLSSMNPLAPKLAPLAPKLARTVARGCLALEAVAESAPTGAVAASACGARALVAVAGGCVALNTDKEGAKKEETPGDRRRAFLYRGRVGAKS
jgi:integrase